MEPKGSSQSTVDSRLERPLVGFPSAVNRRLLTLFVFGMAALASAQVPTPSGLGVVGNTDGQVNLAWTPDVSAAAYGISRQLWDLTTTPTPNATQTPTAIATVPLDAIPPAPTPAYQDFQVTDGRVYLYRVWGIDSSQNPGLPASVTAAPYFPPSPVQPVTISNSHDNALDLSWGVPASSYPVSYYEILRYTFPTATYAPPITYTPSPTKTPGPLHTPTPFTPIPTETPIQTISSRATPTGTLTETSTPTLTPTISPTITATFPPPTFIATFFATPTVIATVFGSSYSDTSVQSNGALGYYYEVLAVDDANHVSSQPTVGSNGGLPAANVQPGKPLLTGILPRSTYGVSLFWSGNLPAEGVTAYQVLQNSTPIATIAVAVFTPTVSYFDATIPSNGQATTYVVEAQNAYGTGESLPLAVTVNGCSVASVSAVPTPSPAAVVLSWAQATPGTYGFAGYAVYKSLGGAPNLDPIPAGSPTATLTPTPFAVFQVTPSSTPSITALVDNGLVNHTVYWVQPFDSVNHGGPLAVAPALNLAPTPASTLVALGPSGNNQVNVSWNGGSAGFFGTTSDWVLFRIVTPFVTPTPVPSGTLTPLPTSTTGSSAPTPTPIATLSFNQTGYLDIVPNYPVSSVVSYQIGLADSSGNLSDIVSSGNAVTLGNLMVPGPPQVLPFTGTAKSVRFSWFANPSADAVTGYAVFGSDLPTLTATTTPTPLAVISTPTEGSTLVFAPTPTPWAVAYYYVSARNQVGASAPATLSGIAVPTYQVTAVMTPGSRQVQVSWNMTPVAASAVTVDSFGVYRSLDPINQFTPVATVELGTNSYTDPLPAATAGVTYDYLVTARAGSLSNQPAESPLRPAIKPFPEGQLSTWPNPPAVVTAVSGVNKTGLSWVGNAPHEDVSSYSVFYINSGGTPTPTGTWNAPTPSSAAYATPTIIATVLAVNSPTSTYAFAATETPGNQSSYFVVANNAQGSSDSAAAITVLAPPAVTPTLQLTPPSYMTPSATLTPGVWISGLTYPNAVGGYTIYRLSPPTPSTTPTYFPVTEVAGPTPFVEDLGMPGYVNNYLVVANTGAVTANPTVSAPLSVALWPSAPNVALLPGASSVTVGWGLPVGNVPVSFYDIYRSAYPTTTPVFVATTTPTAASYIDNAVTTGSAYIYWMDAVNASGPSSLSSPQTIIPIQPVMTLALTPLPERNQLAWPALSVPANSPVTGYAVFRAPYPSPSVTPTFVQVGPVLEPLSNTGTVDATGVVDGNSYLYEVAPSSANTILGPFSNQVTVTVYPQAVSNLEAVSGDGLVQLRWTYQGVASNSYIITRRLGSAPASSAQTLAAAFQGSDFTDSSVSDKTFYVYNVYAVDAVGLTSTASTALALPAAPPALPIVAVQTSNGPVTTVPASVTLAQNASNAQTLVGNTLSWGGADQPASFVSTTMYPLGGYDVLRSSEGGGVYQSVAQLPATYVNGAPAPVASYFDQVPLVNGSTYTYLIQAFDAPPDLPVSLSQAVTQGLVHSSSYEPITAYPISPNTALDRNAIRPFGAPNEQAVNIRFVVTSPGNVEIKAYTLSGAFVREILKPNYYQPGIYWTSWDAKNMNGSLVASGVYLITTESPGGHQEFEKVAVIK